MSSLTQGRETTLEEMLDLREERAARQRQMLAESGCASLVCLSLNMAGPVKRHFLADALFEEGRRQTADVLTALGAVLDERVTDRPAGQTAFFAVDQPAELVKVRMTALEDQGGASRLWDIDVLRPHGTKVSRGDVGQEGRRCFLCTQPAALCARSRAHSVEELKAYTDRLLLDWYVARQAGRIGAAAQRALLYEVSVTPKPGLVDRNNSGAHRDMDFFTFLDSICALGGYFRACARWGLTHPETPARQVLAELQTLGMCAEGEMYRATGGVNTHKGAIFSLGILCAAAGMLAAAGQAPSDDALGALAGEIAAPALGGLGAGAETAGQAAFRAHGLTGARGEAASGFRREREELTALRALLAEGRSLNDALALVLLRLIARAEDTNIVKRRGRERLDQVHREAEELLAGEGPSWEDLLRLDESFIREGLSPGGCADLLAVVCFFFFWEEQEKAGA